MSLFQKNTSILLEARKKNVNKKIKINPEDSDYETVVEEDEDEDVENTDVENGAEEGEDYTSYTEEDDSAETSETNAEEDDTDSSTDYSDLDDDSTSDTSDEETGDSDDSSDIDATNYEDETDSSDDSNDSDYSEDDSSESENSSDIDKDIVSSDVEKNRLLITDFLDLYYFTKGILEKLSTVDKGDIMVNSVITQVTKNIRLLRVKLYDYIVNSFSDKYIHNLYQYNLFIQGLNINIEMLKKIKDFNPN